MQLPTIPNEFFLPTTCIIKIREKKDLTAIIYFDAKHSGNNKPLIIQEPCCVLKGIAKKYAKTT